MSDQHHRIYALNLLNRANVAFDVQDVGVVASIIQVLEADVADMLGRYALEVDGFHSVGGGFVRTAVEAISAGRHRPTYELRNDDGSVQSRHNGDGTLIEGEQI